jgi:hypothetical protein
MTIDDEDEIDPEEARIYEQQQRARNALPDTLRTWLTNEEHADVWAGSRLTRRNDGYGLVLRFTEDVDSWLEQARSRSPHPELLEGELAPISERTQLALIDEIDDNDPVIAAAELNIVGCGDADDGVEVEAYAPDEHAAQTALTQRYGPHVRLVYLGTTRPPGSGKFGPW